MRRLLGHVVAAHAHGDADIRLFQCRRIVDPVSGNRDDLSHFLEQRNNTELMLRGDAGKDVLSSSQHGAQLLVGHLGNLGSGHNL